MMNEKQIFELALGLKDTPWYVSEVTLDTEAGSLDIRLDFPPRSQFPRPGDGKLSSVYDTEEKSWRHLNFFQYECHLHAWVPRIDGGEGYGIKRVEVPWARPGSGFTLLMESLLVMMTQSGMTVAEAARMASVTDQRLWRVLFHHVGKAHEKMDASAVTELTVDETNVRRGHEYVTVLCEPGAPGQEGQPAKPTRVLAVSEGNDADAVGKAKVALEARGLQTSAVERVCADMSAAYQKGISEHFPDSQLVFDCFHVVQRISKAVDEVRKRESKKFPELLKGTKYLWLTREENLTDEKREGRRQLCRSKLQTAKAYTHLEAFQDLAASMKGDPAAEECLKWWYNWVCHSRIPEMIKAAKSVKAHWKGIVAYFNSGLTNAGAEAVNGIIQTAKRKSRGFRTFEYFQTIIYLVGSRLTFDLPRPIPR